MHVVSYPVNRRIRRRMYLPSERMVVNGIGLGEVDGFNIGKMFNRMFTFKSGSFKIGNIMGAIGSATSFVGTFGLSSALAPKTFSAHSSTMKKVGMGVVAAGAAAGAYYGGSALLRTGAGTVLKSAGSSIISGVKSIGSNIPSILKTGVEALTAIKGGGGGPSYGGTGGMSPEEQAYLAQIQQQQQQQQQIAAYNAQQQAAYEAQLRAEAQYGNNVPVENQLAPTMYPAMSSGPGSYAVPGQDMQLQSPYSALTDESLVNAVDPTTGLITDPATGNKIDPGTGRIVQAGMLPQLSTTTWLVIGGATLLGWYLMTPSKSIN